MYAVSKKYREKIYSGGALHRASLSINGHIISNSNIKSIKISSPIIDTTQDYFYIGTFLAQKVEIQFKNSDNIDLTGTVDLSIDTKVREASGTIGTEDYDDGYEIVPIGVFLIDTTPEDYYKNAKIVCYDKSILFKGNVDIRDYFDKETIIDKETGQEVEIITSVTAENLLKGLCEKFLGENMLGTYPSLNKDRRIGSFDNTKSGKFYISMIAEIMGGNAKMGRDGKLYIVPLKQPPAVKINAKKSKSWILSEYYKISGVTYENLDGVSLAGNRDNNVLYIRSDNWFLNGTLEDRQNIINDLYNELKNFEIWAVKNENYGDPSLDCWDLIEFQLDDKTYYTLNDNSLTYEMNISTKIETKIPSKQKQEVTNNIKKENDAINKIQQMIDQINGIITTTITRIGTIEGNIEANSYTKQQVNKLIQDVEKGLTNLFTTSGGNNLLTNTAPYRIVSETQLENWNGNISYIREPNSVTKYALKLLNGISSQTIELPNGVYSVGFKYKRLSEGATLKITYNGREINIDTNDKVTYNNKEGLKDENGEITSFGEITNGAFTISFECSADGGFEIYELRLVHGETVIPWTQNQNELKTTSVNIGDGITIDSEQANTINKIDTNGMIVTNKTTAKETLVATDEGIITEDLTSKGKSNISGMLVQRINKKHIYITGIVEE